MRKLSISLVVTVMVNFGFAQNSYPNFELSKFKDFGPVSSNYEYLNKVQNDFTPNQIKYLENVVSYWDANKSEKFEGRKHDVFHVIFKSGRGQIVASYDGNGKVVRAKEHFKNFALPKSAIMAIAKQYPNWKVIKTRYSMLYIKNSRPKSSFKVQLRKDGQKKWLNIHTSGSIL